MKFDMYNRLPHTAIIRALGLVLVIAGVFSGMAAAAGGTVVRVDPTSSLAAPNQTVNVAIKVDNVTNLGAFELHLQFDPNLLQVTQLTHGGFTTADFTGQNTFDNAAGTIDYSSQQINRPAVTGSGTLLTITFQTHNSGVSPINFRTNVPAAPPGVILGDATGALIATDVTPGSVSVVGGAVTPVPATATAPAAPTATVPVPQPTATAPILLPTATAIAISPQPTATLPGPSPLLGNHTVKYGESLFCIGRAYMISPWSIAQANGIGWPYTIYPNQVLKIPNTPWVNPPYGPVCQRQFGAPSPTVTPDPLPTPAPTVVPSACRATYVVMWGDTLSRIAFRFNSNVYLIAQANHIWNINRIYAGRRLCIP